jgi:hypothetical protein
VNRALGSGGGWADQVTVQRPGLEEAFLHLTGDGLRTGSPRTRKEEGRDAVAPR